MKTQLECIIVFVLFIILATMMYLYGLEDFEGKNVNLNNSDMVVNSRYFRDEPKKSTEINFDVLFAGTAGIVTATPPVVSSTTTPVVEETTPPETGDNVVE